MEEYAHERLRNVDELLVEETRRQYDNTRLYILR